MVVYYQQIVNEQKVIDSTVDYCQNNASRSFKLILKKTFGESDILSCATLMYRIQTAEIADQEISFIIKSANEIEVLSQADSDEFLRQIIVEHYNDYRMVAPRLLTTRLWYRPDTWNIGTMLTSTIAHGSWSHLIGNLFFFFVFAATVETILGYLLFPMVLIGLAIGTNIFYSFYAYATLQMNPTLGLSGIVMGIIALFVYFLPKVRIKCLFWFIIIFWRPLIPAWLLAAWFIGWDTYHLFSEATLSGVNLVAHVSGAALAYTMGLVFFRGRKKKINKFVKTLDKPAQHLN